MIINIPGQTVSVRFFERVETTDKQYDVFDVGVQQEDGSIDSLAVGGSFSYARSLCRAADKQAAKKARKRAKKGGKGRKAVAV